MRRDSELRREAEERKREAEKRRKEEALKNKLHIVDGREGSHRKRQEQSGERSHSSERSNKRSRDHSRDSRNKDERGKRGSSKEGERTSGSPVVPKSKEVPLKPPPKVVEPIPSKEEQKPPSRPVTPDLDKPPQDDWRLQNMPADDDEPGKVEEAPVEEVVYDDPIEHDQSLPLEEPLDASIDSKPESHVSENDAAPTPQERVVDPRQHSRQDPYYHNSPRHPASANRSRDHSLERPPQHVNESSYARASQREYDHRAPVDNYDRRAPVNDYESRTPVDEYDRRAPVNDSRQPPLREVPHGYQQHREEQRRPSREPISNDRYEQPPQREVYDSRVEDLPASAGYKGREPYRDPRLPAARETPQGRLDQDFPPRYPPESPADRRYAPETRVVDERAIGRYEDRPVVQARPRIAPSNPYQEGAPPPLTVDGYRRDAYSYHERNTRPERTLVVERRVEETYRLEDSRQAPLRPKYPVHSATGTSPSFPYRARPPPPRQEPAASTYNYDDY